MQKLSTKILLFSILFSQSFSAFAEVPVQSENSLASFENSNKVVEIRSQTDKAGIGNSNISVVEAQGNSLNSNLGTGPETKGPERMPSSIQAPNMKGDCAQKVNQVVRRYLVQVKHCHSSSLKSDPSTGGKIIVDVEIANGQVLSTNTSANKTGDVALASCIERKIQRWSFPSECSSVESFPFVLRPKNNF